MDQDPFAIDQQALEGKLQSLQKHFDRWRQVKSLVGGTEGADEYGDATDVTTEQLQDELHWLTGEIQRGLRSLAWELNDLQETLNAIAGQRPPGSAAAAASDASSAPSASTTANRRLFLSNARAHLASMETEVLGTGETTVVASTPPIGRAEQPISVGGAGGSDVELLLHSGDSMPLPDPSGWTRTRDLLKRYRALFVCVCLVLGLAFVLWVFYEAVLNGAAKPLPPCVCNASSTAPAHATAASTADSSSSSSTTVTD